MQIKIRGSMLILLGVFLNFFGSAIVIWLGELLGVNQFSVFSITTFSDENTSSLIERAVIFLLILYMYNIEISKNKYKLAKDRMVFYSRNSYFILYSLILLSYFTLNVATIDLSFDANMRGHGQFERSADTAISRLNLLYFPLFVFYICAYWRFKSGRVIASLVLLSVVANEVSSADRRILFYYLMAVVYLLSVNNIGARIRFKSQWKLLAICVGSLGLFLSAYVVRFGGEDLGVLAHTIARGTFGALGVGEINTLVKNQVSNGGGLLYGETFINYFLYLFVPSLLLYSFGMDEFYTRGSYLFNDLFNSNANMGYDFMMLADFYWNFGYFGYILYLLLARYMISTVVKSEQSKNPKAICWAIMLTVYFVAGQRSDFGFFLKSAVYSLLILELIYRLTPAKSASVVTPKTGQ